MQLPLTVLGAVHGSRADVLVTVEDGDTVADVARALADALGPGPSPAVVRPLRPGDTVKAYGVVTGGAAASGASGPGRGVLASQARVYEIGGGDAGSVGESTVQVSIVVDDAEAGPLTQAASNGNVALVLVPRAG